MKKLRPIRQISMLACIVVLTWSRLPAQEVIDRIVAQVENDVILLSDVQLLSHYQLLVDGKSEGDATVLDRLIDQWIVRNEATVARTPQPSEQDIDRGLQRLQQSFASKEDYEARRKLAGLTEEDVRRLTADQIYLNSYLDSRFRPSVQVDEQAIQDFYQNAVLPRAKARGQNPPSLDAAHDYIQEALVQRGINEQADRWLKESHGRVHVTKMLEESPR
jgi:parvulin-like peptidyl-prolyl isomerase